MRYYDFNNHVFCTLVLRISHIINPFNAPVGSDNFIAQPVCRASYVRAKKDAMGVADVRLLAVFVHGDEQDLTDDFEVLPALQNSILNFNPGGKRRLPLLKDVLRAAYDAGESDYIVFTNADIAVMPGFYKMIAAYAGKGYDAFSINRRRIHSRINSVDQLEEAFAEAGETHTGYDTIVFRRDLLPRFILGNVCIGIPYFDTTLVHNLYAFSSNYRLFTGKHLSFHIGMQLVKKWGSEDENRHNRNEFKSILSQLYPHFNIAAFPGASLPFFRRHFKWLMNPTFHYPTMLKLDMSQLSKPRRKYIGEKTNRGQRFYNWLIRKVNFPDEY